MHVGEITSVKQFDFKPLPCSKGKTKGKVPHWGTSAPQPQGLMCCHPEGVHSSLEALHTERYTAPQLAKEGTK
jgi:hypothetical protein